MKTVIQTLLALTIFCSCGQQARQHESELNSVENYKIDTIQIGKIEVKQIDKKVGEQLFKSILDTIKIESITKDILINNHWVYRPFVNCESYLKFQDNGKGISYSCEMDENYEMTYRVKGNRVYISEYDIPHVDNQENKKIQYRYDTYVYNGHSLVIINSKMYNKSGIEWTPEIEVLINYDKKKY